MHPISSIVDMYCVGLQRKTEKHLVTFCYEVGYNFRVELEMGDAKRVR